MVTELWPYARLARYTLLIETNLHGRFADIHLSARRRAESLYCVSAHQVSTASSQYRSHAHNTMLGRSDRLGKANARVVLKESAKGNEMLSTTCSLVRRLGPQQGLVDR